MKRTVFAFVSALVFCLSSLPAAAEQSQWLENFGQAKKLAAGKKLPILLLFTGSDWCPACMYMEQEIFSKKEFLSFAEKNFVLMKADFPENKILPDNIKKQNDELKKKYGAFLLPTIVILDSSGKLVQEVTYEGDEVSAYIDVLKKIIAKIKK